MGDGKCGHTVTPNKVTGANAPIQVYAGTVGSARRGPVGETVLNFSGTRVEVPAIVRGLALPELESAVMEIEWPDYGVPTLTRPQWDAIVKAVLERGRPLMVCCVGGHGRTGTALSILLTLMGVVPEDADPVTFVRDAYCDEAVETVGQLNYVGRITGRKVTAKIAPKTWPATYSGSGGYSGSSKGWSHETGWKPDPPKASTGSLLPALDAARERVSQIDLDLDEQSRKFASVSMPQVRKKSRMCSIAKCHEKRAKGTIFCKDHSPLLRKEAEERGGAK
jgi:hypothetical protein